MTQLTYLERVDKTLGMARSGFAIDASKSVRPYYI